MITGSTEKPLDITPRQKLWFNRLGTGKDILVPELVEFFSENSTEIIEYHLRELERLTGYTYEELHEMAPKITFSPKRQAELTRRQIRNRMANGMPFLNNSIKAKKETGMREAAITANDYIKDIISSYFPGEEQVKMNNEVEMCNDAATLRLMSLNDELAPKVKFEAGRKLILLQLLGEIKDYTEKVVDHQEAIQYMFNFFNEKIFHLHEGERMGETTIRYLVSHHTGKDHQAKGSEIMGEKPRKSELGENDRVTHLEMRRTIVKNEDGEEREIYFSIEAREKTVESRLTKALRFKSHIGVKDVDRNGIRMVFETLEDWEDFKPGFKEYLETHIREDLDEHITAEKDKEKKVPLKSRLQKENAPLGDPKGKLDRGEFKGSSPSSSSELKTYKFSMIVFRASGDLHTYEFQILLPDGYADTRYRKGVNWEEYDVNRFFDQGVDGLLFPVMHYSEINRKALRKKLIEQARRKAQNGSST